MLKLIRESSEVLLELAIIWDVMCILIIHEHILEINLDFFSEIFWEKKDKPLLDHISPVSLLLLILSCSLLDP